MNGLLLIVAIALLVAALVSWRWMPPIARMPLAAALALGLAGYAWQGKASLPGAPTKLVEPTAARPSGARIDLPLMGMVESLDAATNWLMLSESLGRRGKTEDAAKILEGAVKAYTRNADLWVGYGEALVQHGGGRANPAALLAFGRARRLDPGHPGPDFYLGIASVRAGDLAAAERYWTAGLRRAGGNDAVREDFAARLALVRALRAEAAGSR